MPVSPDEALKLTEDDDDLLDVISNMIDAKILTDWVSGSMSMSFRNDLDDIARLHRPPLQEELISRYDAAGWKLTFDGKAPPTYRAGELWKITLKTKPKPRKKPVAPGFKGKKKALAMAPDMPAGPLLTLTETFLAEAAKAGVDPHVDPWTIPAKWAEAGDRVAEALADHRKSKTPLLTEDEETFYEGVLLVATSMCKRFFEMQGELVAGTAAQGDWVLQNLPILHRSSEAITTSEELMKMVKEAASPSKRHHRDRRRHPKATEQEMQEITHLLECAPEPEPEPECEAEEYGATRGDIDRSAYERKIRSKQKQMNPDPDPLF